VGQPSEGCFQKEFKFVKGGIAVETSLEKFDDVPEGGKQQVFATEHSNAGHFHDFEEGRNGREFLLSEGGTQASAVETVDYVFDSVVGVVDRCELFEGGDGVN
jgi:hypothetical protein